MSLCIGNRIFESLTDVYACSVLCVVNLAVIPSECHCFEVK